MTEVIAFAPAAYDQIAVRLRFKLGGCKTFYLDPAAAKDITPGQKLTIHSNDCKYYGTVDLMYPRKKRGWQPTKPDGGKTPPPKGAA